MRTAAKGVRIGSKARSKYGAVRTTVDGISFHSAKEARRYGELKLLERARKIAGLELQPEYLLSVDDGVFPTAAKVLLGRYRADFRYRTVPKPHEDTEIIVEDVKGFKTPLYRWKKKHVEAQYGVVIRET
jgi:hypothetical protein